MIESDGGQWGRRVRDVYAQVMIASMYTYHCLDCEP